MSRPAIAPSARTATTSTAAAVSAPPRIQERAHTAIGGSARTAIGGSARTAIGGSARTAIGRTARTVLAAIACVVLACAACTPTETVSPVPVPSTTSGTLDLEIRGSAEITLTALPGSDTQTTVVVTGAAAPHLLDDGTKLEGAGRFEPLPEAGTELFAAKLSLPADLAGPCGAKPRAVALSLVHRTAAPRFAGALTVYCGTDHFGIPARVFRLSGTLTVTQ